MNPAYTYFSDNLRLPAFLRIDNTFYCNTIFPMKLLKTVANAITAQLLCHLQWFVAIHSLGLKQNEILIFSISVCVTLSLGNFYQMVHVPCVIFPYFLSGLHPLKLYLQHVMHKTHIKLPLVTEAAIQTRNTNIPNSNVHGANVGPTWVLSAPDGPHVGPINLAIRDGIPCLSSTQ